MHKDSEYGPHPGLAFALIAFVIIGLVWGEQIAAFVRGLSWNVQVGIFGIFAVGLGLAAVAALSWRTK